MKTHRPTPGIALAVLALALITVVPDPTAAAAAGGVAGEGSGVLVMPPFTGDRVIIVLEAAISSAPGSESRPGRFDVTHLDKSGREFARLAGSVTCVEVHGNTAFVTGEVERGHAPDVVGNPVGQVLPITIADRGSDDLAGLAPPSRVTPRCSPAPLNTVIDQGDFTVEAAYSGNS